MHQFLAAISILGMKPNEVDDVPAQNVQSLGGARVQACKTSSSEVLEVVLILLLDNSIIYRTCCVDHI